MSYQYEPYKWWVNNILPLVYDDSLSYYEVLSKLKYYVDGLVGDVSRLTQIVNTIEGIGDIEQFTEMLNRINDKIGELEDLQTTDKSDIVSAINSVVHDLGLTKLQLDKKYTKPATGIPESDLSAELQEKINEQVAQDKNYNNLNNKPKINHIEIEGDHNAEYYGLGTYNLPVNGIPESDLAVAVRDKINASSENTEKIDGIAPSINAMTADRNYNAGEILYINGVLYRVKTKVAANAPFVIGSNIEQTTLNNELEDISDEINDLKIAVGAESYDMNSGEITTNDINIYTLFFRYFPAKANEDYLFIVMPTANANNAGYNINVYNENGDIVYTFNSGNGISDYRNERRFTFTPSESGNYYCGIKKDINGGSYPVIQTIKLQYTETQSTESLVQMVSELLPLKNDVDGIEIDVADLRQNVASNTRNIKTLENVVNANINDIYDVANLPDDAVSNYAWIHDDGPVHAASVNGWGIHGGLEGYSVNEGETYAITAAQGSTQHTRIWIVTDENYNILKMADNHASNPYVKYTETVVIPAGGKKLLVTGRIANSISEPKILAKKYTVKYLEQPERELSMTYVSGGLTTSGTPTDTVSKIRVDAKSMKIMHAGDIIRIDEEYLAFLVFSSTTRYQNFIGSVDYMNGTYTVPEMYDGYYVGCVIKKVGYESSDISDELDTIGNHIKFIKKLNGYENGKYNILKNLKFSVMGDSMSAMDGYVPEGNIPYYSGGNRGVFSPEQMWWGVLSEITGMTPLIINAWSGSGVSQLEGEGTTHGDATPMSNDSRCSNLGEDPDVIIIAGGTNDYIFAASNQSVPSTWDGKDVPVEGNSFTEAYATMIKRIRTHYPNAIIVCLSTWFVMATDYNGYNYTHSVRGTKYTPKDYDDSIKRVCEVMRVPYININDVGFNPENYYPQYSNDTSTYHLHYNARGHRVIGKAISDKIYNIISGMKANGLFKYSS